MKQSQRIKCCREYHNHPLRKEYEMKKSEISTKMPLLYYLSKIPMFLIIPYLVVAAVSFYHSYWGELTIGTWDAWDIFVRTVGLGIVNLIIFCPISVLLSDTLKDKWAKKYNKEAFEKLEKEYAEKGLVEITEQELFYHECCEYDGDDFVCCVTKRPLSNNEYYFCKTPGNCKHCKTFASAYIGEDSIQYWSYEFEK